MRKMKKGFAALLAITMLAVTALSVGVFAEDWGGDWPEESYEPTYYTIHYLDNDGYEIYWETIEENHAVNMPMLFPTIDGYIFSHWYDPWQGTDPFQFGYGATGDLTLMPYLLPIEQSGNGDNGSYTSNDSGFTTYPEYHDDGAYNNGSNAGGSNYGTSFDMSGILAHDDGSNASQITPMPVLESADPTGILEAGNAADNSAPDFTPQLTQADPENILNDGNADIENDDDTDDNGDEQGDDYTDNGNQGTDEGEQGTSSLPTHEGADPSDILNNDELDGDDTVPAEPGNDIPVLDAADPSNILNAGDDEQEGDTDVTEPMLDEDTGDDTGDDTGTEENGDLTVEEDDGKMDGMPTLVAADDEGEEGETDIKEETALTDEESADKDEDAETDEDAGEQEQGEETVATVVEDDSRYVKIGMNVGEEVVEGQLVEIYGTLYGYDGLEYSLTWQYNDGNGWTNVDGANGLNHSFVLNDANYHWQWQLVVEVFTQAAPEVELVEGDA